jgi:acylphosphatase
MSNSATVHVIIHGHVQGVFFRNFVAEIANEYGLKGFVRNLPSKLDVEVQAEGEKEQLERLVEKLKIGPPAAKVEKVITTWNGPAGKYSHFFIKD